MKWLLLFLIFVPKILWADANSNSSQLLIGENNGTNAGRYRSLKFSNGTTTNNNDGSISVSNSGGGGGGSSLWVENPGNTGINTLQPVSIGTTSVGTGFNLVDTGGNVGIGTWVMPFNNMPGVPSQGLAVVGSFMGVLGADFQNTSSAGFEGFTLYDDQGNFGALIGEGNSNNFISGSSSFDIVSANPVQIGAGLGGGSSINLDTGGNIGINFGSVVNKLGIQGPVAIGNYAQNSTAPSGTSLIMDGNVGIGTFSPQGPLQISSTVLVTQMGYVGIGTNTPVNFLDVRGAEAVGNYAGVNQAPNAGLIVFGNVGVGTFSPSGNLAVGGTRTNYDFCLKSIIFF